MELIEAVLGNDIDLVNRLLLNPHVNVNQTDPNGNTPLILAALRKPAIGQRLILAGADINQANNEGITPLMMAVARRNKDFVILLLEQDGLDINAKANLEADGNTALSKALLFRREKPVDQEIVELLLDSGADPNIPNVYTTPLILAVKYINMVNLLLDHGANPNHHGSQTGNTPLIAAAKIHHNVVVERLLEIKGLDIDAINNDGASALATAAYSGGVDYEIVKLLLAHGADPTMINKRRIPYKPTVYLIIAAEEKWAQAEVKASQELTKKFMISGRLRKESLPQKQLPDYIIRRAEYDNLCVGLQSNLMKPGVIALAKSLSIKTVGQTKTQLCENIANKLIK